MEKDLNFKKITCDNCKKKKVGEYCYLGKLPRGWGYSYFFPTDGSYVDHEKSRKYCCSKKCYRALVDKWIEEKRKFLYKGVPYNVINE